jgi:ribose 5-phosphate isomerase B
MKTIVLGSDHAGIMLKEQIKSYLLEEGYFILDKGCYTSESCDYPDIAELVCREINSETKGILVCGTGIGMSIKANRYNHIRCGLCTNELMAEMTRKHNNANVLAIGARILDNDTSFKIITKFLNTEFEGGRHQKRINKLNIDSIRDIADIL